MELRLVGPKVRISLARGGLVPNTGRMRFGAALAFSLAACAHADLHLQPSCVGVVVTANDGLFAEYRTDGRRGPVLWPLCGPGGVPLTRSYPFAEIEGESRDHPHHESCWFAHGAVNGVDCWAGDGSIVALGCPEVDAARAEIRQSCVWRDAQGAILCRDRRTLRFWAGDGWRAVDFRIAWWRDDGELRIGDTKEGTMALRVCDELRLAGPNAHGAIRNSEGDTGNAAWGKRARWVAYAAELEGVQETVAMFDAPENHGYPTYWHARDYGLFAANPFGLHDFAGLPPGSGDLVLAPGERCELRYRIWMKAGACDAATIEAAWQDFAQRRD